MMTGEDLYKEEQCTQCGQNKLKNASFCPHCGYVKKRTLFDSLRERFSGSSKEESVEAKPGMGVSTFVGLIFAGYLLYTAIVEESIQSIIIASLILFTVLQSWYAARKRRRKGREASAGAIGEVHEADSDPLEDKFFCENCGNQVAAEAKECPKCGMKFG
ncbi:MAG TPA: zinc ribbon domain-containing protein [Bacteroidota bacterium]